MKLSQLLDRLKIEKELKVEERSAEGVQQYIVWTIVPFPKNHSEWYVFTLPQGTAAEEFEIEQWQINAMLRHLWMFSLTIGDEDDDSDAAEMGIDVAAQVATDTPDEE
jgi:hypothetical protein